MSSTPLPKRSGERSLMRNSARAGCRRAPWPKSNQCPPSRARKSATECATIARHFSKARSRFGLGQEFAAARERTLDRDHFMSAEQARDWGLIIASFRRAATPTILRLVSRCRLDEPRRVTRHLVDLDVDA